MKRYWVLVLILCFVNSVRGQTQFQNVTESLGLTEVPQLLDRGDRGVPVAGWLDYNNDGLLDLLVGSPTIGEEVKLWYNRGTSFVDVTTQVGIVSTTVHGAAIGDYDNDGDVDVYLVRGRSTNVLYRNQGDGVFEDVTESAGVDMRVGLDRASSSFVDYDNDGDLDLFVADYLGANVLYQNQGDGTFVDVAESAGIVGVNNSTHHMFGDYNNDGFMDLFVGHNDYNASTLGVLYRNSKDGRFTDVTMDAGIRDPATEVEGVLFFDYNNDGWQDLFLTTGHHGPFGITHVESNFLYRNNQSGTFTNVTQLTRVQSNAQSAGVMAGDYDHDGWIDVLVSNSRFNHLFRNQSGQMFERTDSQVGIVEEGGVGSVGFGDYNNDGFLDLFLPGLTFMDNAGFVNPGIDVLYQNLGSAGHWLHVELVGIQSNRSGIGARVQVLANNLVMQREVNGGNGYGGETVVAEFGLGPNTQAESVEVRWPSGHVDVISNVPADQKIRVVEGQTDFQIMRPVQWTHDFPDSVSLETAFEGQATIRPELFVQDATVTQVKLVGLGDAREVLLQGTGGDAYVLDDTVTLTGESGNRMLRFVIEQQTSLGVYKTSLPIPIVATPALLPMAVIAEQTIDFGQVEVERSGQVGLTLHNSGMGSLTIQRVETDMSAISVLIANTIVAPGDSTQVLVAFRPLVGGDVSGVIDLATNDPDQQTIRLTYTGSAVVVPADPRTDFDGNGEVGFADFLAFVRVFGSADMVFDLDGSGSVDFGDFLIFVQSFGKSVM